MKKYTELDLKPSHWLLHNLINKVVREELESEKDVEYGLGSIVITEDTEINFEYTIPYLQVIQNIDEFTDERYPWNYISMVKIYGKVNVTGEVVIIKKEERHSTTFITKN